MWKRRVERNDRYAKKNKQSFDRNAPQSVEASSTPDNPSRNPHYLQRMGRKLILSSEVLVVPFLIFLVFVETSTIMYKISQRPQKTISVESSSISRHTEAVVPKVRPKIRQQQHHNRSTTFLLGVFTVRNDAEQRNLIRQLIFGDELPHHVKSKVCSLDVFLKNQKLKRLNDPCQVTYTFVLGGNETSFPDFADQQKITSNILVGPSPPSREEAESFGDWGLPDMTYLNVRENMNEGKVPSWFRYASNLPGIDYVAKLDSDSLISLPALLNLIDEELPSSEKSPPPLIYGGNILEFVPYNPLSCTLQASLSPEICKKARGMFYMQGAFYFFSKRLAKFVALRPGTLSNVVQIGHEDFDMGARAFSHSRPIQTMVLNGDKFWYHEKKAFRWKRWVAEFKKVGWNADQIYSGWKFRNQMLAEPLEGWSLMNAHLSKTQQ